MKKLFYGILFCSCSLNVFAVDLLDSYVTDTQVITMTDIRIFYCVDGGVSARSKWGINRYFAGDSLCEKLKTRKEFTLFPNGRYYSAPDFVQCTNGVAAFPWFNEAPEYVSDPGCAAYNVMRSKANQ